MPLRPTNTLRHLRAAHRRDGYAGDLAIAATVVRHGRRLRLLPLAAAVAAVVIGVAAWVMHDAPPTFPPTFLPAVATTKVPPPAAAAAPAALPESTDPPRRPVLPGLPRMTRGNLFLRAAAYGPAAPLPPRCSALVASATPTSESRFILRGY